MHKYRIVNWHGPLIENQLRLTMDIISKTECSMVELGVSQKIITYIALGRHVVVVLQAGGQSRHITKAHNSLCIGIDVYAFYHQNFICTVVPR